MSNVIPFRYQGQPVRFNTDGWINATDIAERGPPHRQAQAAGRS